MTHIVDLMKNIENFRPFYKIKDELMDFKYNTRSKIFTLEIMTDNLNKIVKSFVHSSYEKIEDFFKSYIKKEYPHSKRRQKHFCYTLILSLLYYKQQYNYPNLYYNLFGDFNNKNIYFFFDSCKDLIFHLKNRNFGNFANIDEIYLKDKEWIYILN